MFSEAVSHFIQRFQYPGFYPKAVFFDMDGVLFDSMKFHASSWVKAMTDIGIPFTQYEAYMNEGRTGHSTINGAFNKVHRRDATEEEKQQIYRLKSSYFEACGLSPRMPFALNLLELVRGQELKIFLVTGSGQPSLLDSLQTNFPDFFCKENMVTAFDVKHGKPHPEPYLMALQKSGVKPWEAVVVENAPLGTASAHAAGIFTVAVNTGVLEKEVLIENGADVVFDSVEEFYFKWEAFKNSWLEFEG